MSQAAVHCPPVRLDASVVPGAKPAPFPGFIEPCHPTLREEAPSGGDWVHEIKLDGYRTQAHLRSRRPAVYTRAGYDRTLRFQTIADALANLPADELILDGDAVVAGSRDISDFGLLRAALARGFEMLARQDRGRSANPARASSGCKLAFATRTDSSASLVASVKTRSVDERV
jgi:ATP-dependent DNA ligase